MAPTGAASTRCKTLSKKKLPQAIADGHFTQADHFMPGMKKIGKHGAQLNGGHVFDLNGLSARSLSDGMIVGRKLAVEYTRVLPQIRAGLRAHRARSRRRR